MMTSSNGNIFRVTGPLWGEISVFWPRLIPRLNWRYAQCNRRVDQQSSEWKKYFAAVLHMTERWSRRHIDYTVCTQIIRMVHGRRTCYFKSFYILSYILCGTIIAVAMRREMCVCVVCCALCGVVWYGVVGCIGWGWRWGLGGWMGGGGGGGVEVGVGVLCSPWQICILQNYRYIHVPINSVVNSTSQEY